MTNEEMLKISMKQSAEDIVLGSLSKKKQREIMESE